MVEVFSQSSQLFSTVSFTLLVYSLRLSLYRLEASTLAGDEVFGSLSRLRHGHESATKFSEPGNFPIHRVPPVPPAPSVPLNTCQDRCHIVCGAPSVLEDIQTKLARAVDVGVEHLTDELDSRWLIRILLLEVHDEAEGAIFERGVCGPNDNSVPM